MTKAIRIHENGGPEVMRWEDVTLPPPAADEVRLRHTAKEDEDWLLVVTAVNSFEGEDQPFVIDWNEAESQAQTSIDEFNVKGRPSSTAESLSGGNQQRLLLALMPEKLRLLLMEHPTRGLDIESAEYVWEKILQRREGGTAIVFASADLDELLTYSDRIIVCFSGDILKVLDAPTTDGEELGYLIGGRERT